MAEICSVHFIVHAENDLAETYDYIVSDNFVRATTFVLTIEEKLFFYPACLDAIL